MSKDKKEDKAPLCGCSPKCREFVKWDKKRNRWNEYINGHQNRGNNFFKQFEKAPLCQCGCGELVTWDKWHSTGWNKYSHGHIWKGKKRPDVSERLNIDNHMKTPEHRKMMKENNPMHSPEAVKKNSDAQKGKPRPDTAKRMKEINPMDNLESRKKMSKSNTGKIRSKEFCDNLSKQMLDGGAAYRLSFVKNPSKPQVELYNLIKQLYPSAILNYPSLNRSIDIAIPNKLIAVEYDGSHWHQDKEADEARQKQLEAIGWMFLRYCDYIPPIEELKVDLRKIIVHD